MKRIYSALFATALLALAMPATAAVSQIECPAEISSPSIQIRHLPGWSAFVQYPLKLASAGMSAGPPGSLAVLRGSQLNSKNEAQSTRYEFSEVGFEKGKWLDCGYGEGSEITLSKRLDDNLKECTITYPPNRSRNWQKITIACQ
ncbi:MAG: STY0301 family protein [Massilia sp.]